MANEFLNPKSMVTPGIAGGIIVLITNALRTQFQLPGNWSSLLLSFLFGTIVFGAATIPLLHRVVFYLVNSLIIFSVAVGANSAGAAAQKPAAAVATLFQTNTAHLAV